MVYSVICVWDIQKYDPVKITHTSIVFQILLSYRLLQSVKISRYWSGCHLSFILYLHIIQIDYVYIFTYIRCISGYLLIKAFSFVLPLALLPFSKSKFVSWVSESYFCLGTSPFVSIFQSLLSVISKDMSFLVWLKCDLHIHPVCHRLLSLFLWQRMRWLDGITDSMDVWVNSGSWWWTGRPGVLRFMGFQRVGHDWATELNWMVDCTCAARLPHPLGCGWTFWMLACSDCCRQCCRERWSAQALHGWFSLEVA